jgi:DNA (cytosine-5)-methyltransferase 1
VETPSPRLPLSIVDLFAGAGGLSEGFRQAGFSILAGSDSDPDAATTYALNFPEADVVVGDVRNPDVRAKIIAAARYADVVVGGPPCQGFSQMRNHARLIDDPKNSLYREFVRVVAEVVPRAFVMENVTGIDELAVREAILTDLRLDGEYRVVASVLDAANYGVPQSRRRLLFIGLHRSLNLDPVVPRGTGVTGLIELVRCVRGASTTYAAAVRGELIGRDALDALLDPSNLTAVTVEQAIGDLAGLQAGRRLDEIAYTDLPAPSSAYQQLMREGAGGKLQNVQVPRMNEDTRLRLEGIPPGGNYRDLKEALRERYLTGQRWGQENGTGRLSRQHFYAYRRLHPDIWAWTLNTKADAAYHHRHSRALSVREFARLQAFPDRFVVATDPRPGPLAGRLPNGPAHSRYRQIGNAVPIGLGRALAQELARLLTLGHGGSTRPPARLTPAVTPLRPATQADA